MISAWMAYAILVGVFSAGAAWTLETLLRSHRRPTRWVWTGALALAGLWPLWMALRPRPISIGPIPPPGAPLVVLEPLGLQVASASIWQRLDTPLVFVWAIATAGLLALALLLILRTRRLRKRWVGDEAGGRAVLISEDWGPAVVGFLNPQIVLPRWCRGIDAKGLDLILAHEAEHLRAGDLRLLIVAGLVPVFLPWSLPLWWMWHRLRLAVEGDCDLRVLQKHPCATRAYLELLLEVGRRFPNGRMAAAMLSEPERTLERRIRIMTMPFPKKPLVRGGILAGVGLILVAVACLAPSPTALDDEAELPAVTAVPQETPMSALAQSVSSEPVFTPFTVRPDIKNRGDIARAMEENYPPLLREAGIGGTVTVWFFIDEAGVTRDVRLNDSSGHLALDDAAMRVAETIQFTPALNRGKEVPVWIFLPITFSTMDARAREESKVTARRDGQEEGRPVANPPKLDGMEFTPFTNPPVLLNREAMAAAVESQYPPLLREAGIEGTPEVMLYIDAEGLVQRMVVNRSSGHKALDDAALRVAAEMQFTPALNRDKKVAVWIAFPIKFETR